MVVMVGTGLSIVFVTVQVTISPATRFMDVGIPLLQVKLVCCQPDVVFSCTEYVPDPRLWKFSPVPLTVVILKLL